MNWHYVNQGQQAGPITEEQLLMLLREGKITEETLVWREGMPNWLPFHQAGVTASNMPPQMAGTPSPLPTHPNEAVCAECGKIFPIDETIPYGNVRVCAACKPLFLQKLSEGAKINTAFSGQFEYGGFWIRVGAKLIDGLILGIPLMVIVVIFVIGSGVTEGTSAQRTTSPIAPLFSLLLQFGLIAVQIAYQTFFLGKYGATPGKMVCKLKVVSADGTPIGYGRAVGRAFAEILSGMICYIGYLMVPFDAQKRALHDHICSTRVVHK